MTKREFLNAVIASEVANEIKEYAQAEIEKLNERNANRSSKPTAKQIENESIKAEIVKVITENGSQMVAGEIAQAIEISTQKASALCRQLVESGMLTVQEVKVPKKGKQKAYNIVESEEQTE